MKDMDDLKNKSQAGRSLLIPVMTGFFVMGFVDIVGFANSYVQNDFPGLSNTLSSLISVSCFIWFLLLSVPVGILMNRVGRKKAVVWGLLLTALANIVPVIHYSFALVLVTFALIGMGNTLLQVSLNPLVTDIISSGRLTGTLTFGQFVKAVSSFLAPILAAAFSGGFLSWRMLLLLYAVFSLLSALFLVLSPVRNQKSPDAALSLMSPFRLLGKRRVLLFFIGIVILVGVDVGMGVTLPKLLMQRQGLEVTTAGMGNSVYFFARTLGTFLGAFILMRASEPRFYFLSSILGLLGLLGLAFFSSMTLLFISVALFGLGYANLFAIIFSMTLKYVPDKANEASALLITGVAGGGVVSPLLGLLVDATHTQTSAIWVLLLFWIVIVALSLTVKKTARPMDDR